MFILIWNVGPLSKTKNHLLMAVILSLNLLKAQLMLMMLGKVYQRQDSGGMWSREKSSTRLWTKCGGYDAGITSKGMQLSQRTTFRCWLTRENRDVLCIPDQAQIAVAGVSVPSYCHQVSHRYFQISNQNVTHQRVSHDETASLFLSVFQMDRLRSSKHVSVQEAINNSKGLTSLRPMPQLSNWLPYD